MARIIAAVLETAAATTDKSFWNSLNPRQRAHYRKLHPRSPVLKHDEGVKKGAVATKRGPSLETPQPKVQTLPLDTARQYASDEKRLLSCLRKEGLIGPREKTKGKTLADLGFDELDVNNLAMAVEEEFGFEIPDKRVRALYAGRSYKTLDNVIALLPRLDRKSK